MEFIDTIKFDEKGLVPAIAQDARTGTVLMLAYMNREALETTFKTRKATYFSRSRNELWEKGATSGNTQRVVELYYDCDADAVLLKVDQTGNACHTGKYTCFHNAVLNDGAASVSGAAAINDDYAIILDRIKNPRPGSYTNYLFEKGIDKMCKKVGEEASEVIIAAKNGAKDEVVYEIADLIYHLLVVMAHQNVTPEEIYAELEKRREPLKSS